jgi:Holliday junction DNA helicase RuvA
MIGKLTGLVDSVGDDWAIVDVGGVGYLVHASAQTLARLPGPGQRTTLFVETQIGDDRIRLIGFLRAAEREWFRLLLGVPGVGTKVALGVLGTLDADDLSTAIALGDKAAIARSPGVGPKVAQRIVAELKDKVSALADIDSAHAALRGALDDKRAPRPVADAVSALVNLGYAEVQASGAIAAAMKAAGEGATAEELIRRSLKELVR